MGSTISVLDSATTNKIAAGEVVERPSSCVKELTENAIDAGSSAIEIEIADGGQRYIRVSDNGCGMSQDDAKMCIIRHATSKIRTVEDIYAISSLGFRGEAVPSIASVSRMQITTRQKSDEYATHLVLEGGEIQSEDQVGAPIGTTIEVSDLFFNTPARRKFLKSERTECSKISEMITKLALAHPSIEFTFINNSRTTLHTNGNGKLLDVIANIYGTSLAKETFPVVYDSDDVHIEGFVGKPSVLKSSRAWQTCIVNHRMVQNSMLYKAIENAYHAMLPKSGYPFAMLHLQMDPASIDVNVHPQKTEIKFADEQIIYRAVYHCIIKALLDHETPEKMATPFHAGKEHAAVQQKSNSDFALSSPPVSPQVPTNTVLPFESKSPQTPYAQTATPAAIHETMPSIKPFSQEAAQQFSEVLNSSPRAAQSSETSIHDIVFDDDETVFIPLGQVGDCFIIAKKGNDLYIIDQHAAHERIRYDKYCLRVERMPSQQLLTPEFVEVDPSDMTLLLEQKSVFEDLGYAYSEAGPAMIRVEETPCDLMTSKIAESIKDICLFLHDEKQPDKAEIRHRSLAYLSCHGAIKAGDTLNMREIKYLIDELFKTATPFVCPHGRPVIIRFTPDDLGKLFKRT